MIWGLIFEDLSGRAVGGWMAPGVGKDGVICAGSLWAFVVLLFGM